MSNKEEATETIEKKAPSKKKINPREQFVRLQLRFMYDLQRMRIAAGNRTSSGVEGVHLSSKDKEFLAKVSGNLEELEKDAEKAVFRALKGIPIYEEFLKDVKGIGPRLAGYLISELNPENCETVSQLWRWCGLAVIDGKAEKRKKGFKAGFDPKRKAKMLGEGGVGYELKIKKTEPYYSIYKNYKHRKETMNLKECMGCHGTGKRTQIYEPEKKKWIDPFELSPKRRKELEGSEIKKREKECWNCEGTGGPAPWGNSKKHREQAAIRRMTKEFLRIYYLRYRELAGLPVRPSYHVEKLGMAEHKS